jgi:hypothetical protein
MTRRPGPGLTNSWVQAQVADQFASARETANVADRRDG